MGILERKLFNFIKHNLGQFLAATAVVMIGIMFYISMNTTYSNLSRSQANFYNENNFADYYFQVVKAPEEVVRQIENVAGVKRVTGRIQMDLPILKAHDERATARLVSYSLPMENELNRITLEQGHMFAAGAGGANIEVLLDRQYAQANRISWGDQIAVIVDGRERVLTAAGMAVSPEFIYPMKSAADILPDPLKFGIFMAEQRQVQQLLNMPGQINQVLLEFTPGADQSQVTQAVGEILKPYGLLVNYPRKYQTSHAVLQAKLDGIRTMSAAMPAIFMFMAALIQFIILRRMVKTQRTQIGVMKAVGYSSRLIMIHYTMYALAVSMLGAVLGTVMGIFLAGSISSLFAQYFNLPGGLQGYDVKTMTNAFLLSLVVGLAAGMGGSRGVLKIQPAEAMRAEPPQKEGKSWLEKWPQFWNRVDPGWKMTLRSMGRNRGRFIITLIGVIFAVSLLIMAFFYNDAVDYMMKKSFTEGETYDLTVRFNSPVAEDEILNLNRLEGVLQAEPFMEVPVRIHFRGQAADELLLAYQPEMQMKKLQDEKGRVIRVPQEGIIINQRTGDKLGIKSGDRVEVETLLMTGPIHRAQVKIVGVTQQLFGGGSYINLEQANRILQESRLMSGTLLDIEPGRADRVEHELGKMLGITSVISRQKEIQIFKEDMSVVTSLVSIMVFFAVVLGFAIVYNASVINFAERRRELASLRVMGFTVKEIASLLFKENIILLGIGIILGLPFGRIMIKSYVQSVATDQFTLPAVIYPITYILAALGSTFFILVAHRFAVRGLKDLDMVATLKNTE